jgi:hypothetical protein
VTASAPSAADAFANPLQVGSYSAPSAPVTLSAEEQADLSAYEKTSRGIPMRMVWMVALFVAGGALFVGYLGNNIAQERKFVNASIDASITAKKNVDAAFKVIDEIQALVKALKPGILQLDATKRLPDTLQRLDGGSLLYSVFPLPKELTPLMGKFVADANQLIDQAASHRRIILRRDKDALAAIKDGLGPMEGKQLVLRALPMDPKRGP